MDDVRNMVMALLTQYRETQRHIEMLRYEIAHPPAISAEEMIEALAFGHGENSVSTQGGVSNKTLYTALNYQDKMQKVNESNKSEIAVQLIKLEKQQERLHYYIGLMDKQDAEVIRMTYVDGLDNDEIAARLGVSVRTVRTRRAKAIDLLCDMYAYTASLQSNGSYADPSSFTPTTNQ